MDRKGGSVDWNARYEAGDTPWEKGGAHPALAALVEAEQLAGKVLVPGCGSGHDVRALAARGLEAVGLDVAPLAIARARGHPPAGREAYVLGDLFGLPPEFEGAFDAAFEHTCFCAIDPARRADYAAAVYAALKPGAKFLAIFYADPDHGEGPPFGCSRAELDGLFAGRFRLISERRGFPTHPGREGRELARLMQKV